MLRTDKIDKLKQWIKSHKYPFSTTHIKRYGNMNFYTSADVRSRELAVLGFMRKIPLKEAFDRGLVKKGDKNILWYEV